MSDQIRLGIIGLHNHYHIYPMADYLAKGLPGLALVSVYDERTTLAREFAVKYQVPEVHDSRESLLEQSEIDAVIITSDTASHHGDLLASVSKKSMFYWISRSQSMRVRRSRWWPPPREQGSSS